MTAKNEATSSCSGVRSTGSPSYSIFTPCGWYSGGNNTPACSSVFQRIESPLVLLWRFRGPPESVLGTARLRPAVGAFRGDFLFILMLVAIFAMRVDRGTSSSESSESEESSSALRAPMCAPAGGACFFSIFCLCSAIESTVFRSRPAGAPLAFDLASWLFACPSRPARAARGTSSSDEELIGLTTRVSCAAPNELQLNTEYRPFQSSGAKVTQIGDRTEL
mmetsp:Transcript_14737/g.42049  ORF Transcript_14737/g.42049 Transcript_14737/m.42049 type:complete len:221 (-) Transcript_14737:2-664(-)